MAIASIPSARVIDRLKGTFKAESGEDRQYYQVRIVDEDTRDIIVVSSATAEPLAQYEPGKVFKDVRLEVVSTAKINVTRCRPIGSGAGQERW